MPGSIDVDVPRGQEAPAIARRLVRDRLGGVLPPPALAEALVIVSELVANAVVHGDGAIRLVLDADEDVVRGEIVDEGEGFEVAVRERGVGEVGGHGLFLVGSLARRWGIHEGSSHVWFELPVREDAAPATPPELGEDRRPDELD